VEVLTAGDAAEDDLVARHTTVEVNGKRFDVKMWVPETTGAVVKKSKKPTRAAGAAAGGGGSGEVSAPMQGTIVKVNVAVGATVQVGDPIVVLEAMKMENQITAEKAGTIAKVNVAAGDTVGAGDVLAVIE